MGRILGIDYGQKRVGIAVSDPLHLFAIPLQTVTINKVTDFLKKYVEEQPVTTFVVGYPKNLNNTPSDNAPRVMAFVTHLNRIFPDIPVVLADERFTSKMAFQAMIDGGMKRKDRQNKSHVDKISAVLILQEYLQNKTT
ncbi:MAG: Holliday junction resolvase RuvX [Bacteroidales bacterium]|jgi:putative Holliday junction resolvase